MFGEELVEWKDLSMSPRLTLDVRMDSWWDGGGRGLRAKQCETVRHRNSSRASRYIRHA